MSDDKYQFKKKSYYLNLLLLKDELNYFHEMLRLEVKDTASWIIMLRNTRQLFVVLNNVLEAANKTTIRDPEEYVDKTRRLRKTLLFTNHIRNKAAGHYDNTLLERAVQLTPTLFSSEHQSNEEFQIMEGQRAIVEASINSFLDEEDVQKVFKAEIDLMYPPDFDLFNEYIWKVVTEALDWLTLSLSLLSPAIKYYDQEELKEVSIIAGQTEFNLKKQSKYHYNDDVFKKAVQDAVLKLKETGAKQEIIDLLENMIL